MLYERGKEFYLTYSNIFENTVFFFRVLKDKTKYVFDLRKLQEFKKDDFKTYDRSLAMILAFFISSAKISRKEKGEVFKKRIFFLEKIVQGKSEIEKTSLLSLIEFFFSFLFAGVLCREKINFFNEVMRRT